MLQVVVAIAVAPETAFNESKEAVTELLFELQMRNPFVRQRQYEKLSKPTEAGAVETWDLDTKVLLRWSSAVYMPDNLAVIAEWLQANHDDFLEGHFGVSKTKEIL